MAQRLVVALLERPVGMDDHRQRRVEPQQRLGRDQVQRQVAGREHRVQLAPRPGSQGTGGVRYTARVLKLNEA